MEGVQDEDVVLGEDVAMSVGVVFWEAVSIFIALSSSCGGTSCNASCVCQWIIHHYIQDSVRHGGNPARLKAIYGSFVAVSDKC